MVDEGVGFDVNPNFTFMTADGDEMNGLHRRLRLAMTSAETREIMFSQQGLSSLVHAIRVERTPDPRDVLSVDGRPNPAIKDSVAIATASRRKSGMKRLWYRLNPENGCPRMEHGIGAQNPVPFIPFSVAVEMNDLAAPMNAGVGPTCAENDDGVIRDAAQGRFNGLLNRWRLALPLPAVKLRSVVFDPSGQAHGASIFQILPRRSFARARFALDPPLTISSRSVFADSESSMDR